MENFISESFYNLRFISQFLAKSVSSFSWYKKYLNGPEPTSKKDLKILIF